MGVARKKLIFAQKKSAMNEKVYSIIDLHRKRAFQEINNNSLMTAWNVGGYVSQKIKSAQWGSGIVAELSEYLRTIDPTLKSYSKRTLYRMVLFYDKQKINEILSGDSNVDVCTLLKILDKKLGK